MTRLIKICLASALFFSLFLATFSSLVPVQAAACSDPSAGLAVKWTGPGLPSQGVANGDTFALAISKSGSYYAAVGAPNCTWKIKFRLFKNGTEERKNEFENGFTGQYTDTILIDPPATGKSDVYTAVIEVSDNNGVLARQQATLNVSRTGATAGANCTADIFFQDDTGKQYSTLNNVPLNTLNYSIVAVLEKCSTPTSYKINENDKQIVLGTTSASVTKRLSQKLKLISGTYRYDLYSSQDQGKTWGTAVKSLIVIATSGRDSSGELPPTNGPVLPDAFDVSNVNYDASCEGCVLESLINAKSVPDFFAAIVKLFFLGIAGWSVIFILIGSYKLMMSRGNSEATANGKKTITWAILGLCVSLLSYSIVAIFQTILGI